MKKVPVRVQIWMDGTRLDVRGWLDEFTVNHPPIDAAIFDGVSTYLSPTVGADFILRAHGEQGWKFGRDMKPKVEG